MIKKGRLIFRKETVQEYIAEQDKTEFPRLISPRVFIILWVLIGVLIAIGSYIWMVKRPIYISGHGVFIFTSDGMSSSKNRSCVLAVFPSETVEHLRKGQKMMIYDSQIDKWSLYPMKGVDPIILSPEEIQSRLSGQGNHLNHIFQASAVVVNCFSKESGISKQDVKSGKFQVQVEIGQRRLITFLPILDQIF